MSAALTLIAIDVAEAIEAALGTVPAADDTANDTVARILGNKQDAAQTTVGTTRSIMAYAKGSIALGRYLYDVSPGTTPTAGSLFDLARSLEARAISSVVANSIADYAQRSKYLYDASPGTSPTSGTLFDLARAIEKRAVDVSVSNSLGARVSQIQTYTDILDDGTYGLVAMRDNTIRYLLQVALPGTEVAGSIAARLKAAEAEIGAASNSAVAPPFGTSGSVQARLRGLSDYWTATRAGYIDNLNGLVASRLDANITSRAPDSESWVPVSASKPINSVPTQATGGVYYSMLSTSGRKEGVVSSIFIATQSAGYLRVTLAGQSAKYIRIEGAYARRYVLGVPHASEADALTAYNDNDFHITAERVPCAMRFGSGIDIDFKPDSNGDLRFAVEGYART